MSANKYDCILQVFPAYSTNEYVHLVFGQTLLAATCHQNDNLKKLSLLS